MLRVRTPTPIAGDWALPTAKGDRPPTLVNVQLVDATA